MRGSVTARHAGVWSDIERWLRRHPVLLQSSVYMSDRITRVVVVVVLRRRCKQRRNEQQRSRSGDWKLLVIFRLSWARKEEAY